jgi:hypothetical protein
MMPELYYMRVISLIVISMKQRYKEDLPVHSAVLKYTRHLEELLIKKTL